MSLLGGRFGRAGDRGGLGGWNLTRENVQSPGAHRTGTDRLGGDGTRGLAEAYTRHGAAVYELACCIAGAAEAENVATEAFRALWQSGRSFAADGASLRTTLLALAHRHAVHVLRSDSERRTRFMAMAAADVEEESWARAGAHVADLLSTLSPAARRVIVLAYFGGYSYREIAAILGEPEDTVKTLLLQKWSSGKQKRTAPTGEAHSFRKQVTADACGDPIASEE